MKSSTCLQWPHAIFPMFGSKSEADGPDSDQMRNDGVVHALIKGVLVYALCLTKRMAVISMLFKFQGDNHTKQ